MKMANCVALLGLVLLGCLSDLAVAQRRASCGTYLLSGKTVSMVCPRNYDPVCGTNGRTYANECALCKDFLRNRALDKKHDGRCVRVDCTGFLKSGSGFSNPCTTEYSPICGTNGITYRNKCQFCNAVASGLEVNLQKYGQCFQVNQPEVYPPQVYPPQVNPPQVYPPQVNPPQVYPQQTIDCSQQKGANLLCTSEYSPICGSDGRTYGNRCKFCNAVTRSSGSLFFSHHGSC